MTGDLRRPQEALRQTDDKILTISQDAGFMNLSNFNRQFKNAMELRRESIGK